MDPVTIIRGRTEPEVVLSERFDAFLFDLDGVVYLDEQPVAGTVEAIERLRAEGVPVRFVTNSSSSTRTAIVEKLGAMGVAADVEQVFTAAWATARHARREGYGRVHVRGSEGLRATVRAEGLTLVEEDPEAVIVGNDRSITYEKLRTTTRVLHRNDVPFLAVNVDPAYPTPEGISPGTGALVAALETASGREPTVIGKPERRLFDLALEGLEDRRVAMVGDTPETDVAGAKNAGIGAILFTKHGRGRDADAPAADAVIGEAAELFEEA